jgi:uncharacterized protein YjbI with pentapeptide repeats
MIVELFLVSTFSTVDLVDGANFNNAILKNAIFENVNLNKVHFICLSNQFVLSSLCEREGVCVCVCVCV